MHYKFWINEKNNRYYKILPHPSLWGVSIVLMWGSLGSKLGNYKIVICDTQEEIEQIINKIAKCREYRGYREYG